MTPPGEQGNGERRTESILELARSLIQVPSQGGIDPPLGVIEIVGDWLNSRRVAPWIVRDRSGETVGVALEVGTGRPPRYCLNACLDTAPFGDVSSWSVPPTGAEIRDGWLFGRGSADSKVAVSIFAHIACALASGAWQPEGTLALLFDADEHTGGFSGIRTYVEMQESLDGVMIGYPGSNAIAIGCRGFWRATVTVSGRSDHSGSRDPQPENAIVKAAAFVALAAAVPLPQEMEPGFPLPPKLTVTQIRGGQGYSIVPDECTLGLDIRLTPSLDGLQAEALVRDLCGQLDLSMPSRTPTVVNVDQTWPAYRLAETSKLAAAMRASAREVLGRDLPLVVVGPSNIGNYLAALGVEATCGFGLNHRNLHAADERIEISSIGAVYEVYRGAVMRLLSGAKEQGGAQLPGTAG